RLNSLGELSGTIQMLPLTVCGSQCIRRIQLWESLRMGPTGGTYWVTCQHSTRYTSAEQEFYSLIVELGTMVLCTSPLSARGMWCLALRRCRQWCPRANTLVGIAHRLRSPFTQAVISMTLPLGRCTSRGASKKRSFPGQKQQYTRECGLS